MSGSTVKKTKVGIVTKLGSEKTATVLVANLLAHKLYKKVIKQSKKYLTHCDKLQLSIGDKVEISSCRPISKNKRWRITKIVKTI